MFLATCAVSLSLSSPSNSLCFRARPVFIFPAVRRNFISAHRKGSKYNFRQTNTFRRHLLFSLAFSFVPFSHPRATAGNDDDDLWFPINRGGTKNARSWPSELIADLHGESSVAVTRVSTAVDPTLRLLFRRRTRYLHWFT